MGIYFSVSAAGDKRETRWQVTEALAKGTRVGFSEALAKKRGTGVYIIKVGIFYFLYFFKGLLY